MLLKRYLIFTALSLVFVTGYTQETIVPLMDNPALAGFENQKKSRLKKAEIQDTLKLPFFDDFSGTTSPLPKPELWTDNYVFINDTYAKDLMSLGVATFDVLNPSGKIYSHAAETSFNADTLTSKPIDLLYPASANIYLSFYYQPQGLGDAPEAKDSLLLDFYNPASKKWWNVWKIKGSGVHPFKAAIIPVVADSFLVKGFQFRFRNLASIDYIEDVPGKNGIVDHWHIDYVKLDVNRTDHDTIMRDVAFSKPMKTLLKDNKTNLYIVSMPWKQFQVAFQNVMRKDIDITYRNNDTLGHKPDRYFNISDLRGDYVTSFYSGNENIAPQEEFHFTTNLEYPFKTDETDSASFEVLSYLNTEPYDIKINDTVRFNQKFSNYFAFDDGSPEYGYGLYGGGASNGMVAYRFTSYYADSLTAVEIFFNSTKDDLSKTYEFMLTVWEGATNGPGKRIFQAAPQHPKDLGKYTRYLLDTALIVNGDFYVGWKQTTEDFLNVGLDRNYNAIENLYYNIGFWNRSGIVYGALMIRPVFGSGGLISNRPEITASDFSIYPNPCSDWLNITRPEESKGNLYATLLTITGKTILQQEITSGSINLGDIPAGLYFLVLTEKGKAVYKGKVLVQH